MAFLESGCHTESKNICIICNTNYSNLVQRGLKYFNCLCGLSVTASAAPAPDHVDEWAKVQ